MFTENLTAFLDTSSGHAVEAIYDGGPGTVPVIFDNEFAEAFGMAGTHPNALGLASTFPAAAVSKSLVIAGVTYTIVGREPVDDGAFVNLRLKRN